jgi:hypothetical protein
MPSLRTRLIVRDDATLTTLGAAFSAMSAIDAWDPPVSAYANAGCGRIVRFVAGGTDAGDVAAAAGEEDTGLWAWLAQAAGQ